MRAGAPAAAIALVGLVMLPSCAHASEDIEDGVFSVAATGRVQQLQEKLSEEVGEHVRTKIATFMRTPFVPIEAALTVLDKGFVELATDSAKQFQAPLKDQLMFGQMLATGRTLDMIYSGMDTGEFFGYFSSLGSTYRAADTSPPSAMSWAPFSLTADYASSASVYRALDESNSDIARCAAWDSATRQTGCEAILMTDANDGSGVGACKFKPSTNDCTEDRCVYDKGSARMRGLDLCRSIAVQAVHPARSAGKYASNPRPA